jgi:hypothetical protein
LTLLGLALAADPANPLTPPCRVPAHAVVATYRPQSDGIGNAVGVYDRDTGAQTCAIVLPRGTPPNVAVQRDGRIVVAVRAEKERNFSTDYGHVDVIAPDGRLLHRLDPETPGTDEVAVDNRGHVFVATGWQYYVNGATVSPPATLAMYDVDSMRLVRRYAVGTGFSGTFTVSPDGARVAVLSNVDQQSTQGDGRIDVLDAATGAVLRTIALGKNDYRLDDDAVLIRQNGNTWSVVSFATGARSGTRTFDPDADEIIDGVRYHSDDAMRPITQGGRLVDLSSTTTISRHVVTSGETLPPIVIEGVGGITAAVDPDPGLASARPGAETIPPPYPSLADVRRRVAAARGWVFTDAVSGKRIMQLGDFVRVEDPRERSVTVADCTSRAAMVVEGTYPREYRVIAMDPPLPNGVAALGEPIVHIIAPASVEVEVSAVDTKGLHSTLADAGYERRVSMIVPRNPPSVLDQGEYEYARGVTLASCARARFGGNVLGVEPDELLGARDLDVTVRAMSPALVHVRGSTPTIPANALLVHMESAPQGTLKAAFDVRDLQRIDASWAALFAPPPGYRATTSIAY